jgi:hypothetical protein
VPARRGRRTNEQGGALSNERAAEVMRAYLLGDIDEADARRFFEVYEEDIVTRMMRSPDRLSRWAGEMLPTSNEEQRRAAQRRLDAAKDWQRRILRENARRQEVEQE